MGRCHGDEFENVHVASDRKYFTNGFFPRPHVKRDGL